MTVSYDVEQLLTNTTYQVRLLIGDTKVKDAQLQDEEIAYHLTQRATNYGAAAECCRSIATGYAREADSVQGELRTLYSSKSRQYNLMAMQFETKSTLSGSGVPYAGGISITDKKNQEADTDRVAPQFNIGMDDNYLPVPAVGNLTQDDAADISDQVDQDI